MPRALLLFDVGPGVGAGHMARCLALGHALEERGHQLTLAVNASGIAFLPADRRVGAVSIPPELRSDENNLLALLDGQYELAIVDHYRLDANFEGGLRRHCARVVALDDLADRHHDCDVLIDAAAGQSDARYQDLVPSGCVRLLGPDYALLRSEFLEARGNRSPHLTQTVGTPRILISFGAADSKNVSSLVLDALAGLSRSHTVTVVLGAGAPHAGDLSERVKSHPFPARLIINADNMAQLYRDHDLAIGAPGMSALERACVGIPQILIETAANQNAAARGLANTARSLGLSEALTTEDVCKAVESLLADNGERQRLAAASASLVDGRGAARVAAVVMCDLRDRSGAALVARRLRSDDSDILFSWQMAPETRRYFHDPAPPTRPAHDDFMRSRLTSTGAVTEVLTRSNRPVAIVRADPGDGGYVVSIVVAPEARGQGVGTAALRYLDTLMQSADLTATVLAENALSIAAFRRAGYGHRRRRRLVIEAASTSPQSAAYAKVTAP